MKDMIPRLRAAGIRPTLQRIEIARHVLATRAHPCAEDVLKATRRRHPTVSRATVYNTLNLLVEKGLLKGQTLREGTLVFDPFLDPHHHFIDDRTDGIYDIPWDALRVTGHEALRGFDVRDYQIVLRGRRRG